MSKIVKNCVLQIVYIQSLSIHGLQEAILKMSATENFENGDKTKFRNFL